MCAGVWVNIEIKNDERDPDFDPDDHAAVEVLAALAERGPGRWLLSSSGCAPSTAAACSIRRYRRHGSRSTSARRRSSRRGAWPTAVNPWEPGITAEQIEHCHAAGLLVNAWTCNEPDRFVALAAAGADGIVTDLPDVMVAALGAQGT